MRTRITILFFVLTCFACSQDGKLDSLYLKVGKNGNDSNTVKGFMMLANIFVKQQKYDSALKYANRALTFSQKIKYIRGLGIVFSFKSSYYTYTNKQIDSAVKYGQEYRDYALANKRSNALFFAYNNLAFAYSEKPDYKKALENALNSLSIAEKNNDPHQTAWAHHGIGVQYCYLGDRKSGMKEYDIADSLYRMLNDTTGLVTMLYLKGNAYGALGQFEKALESHLKRIKICESKKDWASAATGYNELAQLYGDNQQPEKALEYALMAYKILKKENDMEALGNASSKVLGCMLQLNRIGEGLEFLETQYKTAIILGNSGRLAQAYDFFSKYYAGKQQFEKAYLYRDRAGMLHDSITRLNYSRETAEMSKKYETEKKDKELLQKDNEIKIQEAESKSKSTQRNFFSIGFALMMALSFFILRGYQQKKKANAEISSQKHIIEEKQKEILDSIHYAKRIQSALMASHDFIDQHLEDNFIYFNPKDIVSGDFYWATGSKQRFYLAICDSTGHGVPGAFMSLLSIGFLSEAINEKNIHEPGKIFNYVRDRLMDSIGRDGQKDGFDGILLCFEQKKISYAAANNKPILLSKGQMINLDADKMPVGVGEKKDSFRTYDVRAFAGDMLFCYTDGYADQFGGPKGKKFKYKKLDEILVANAEMPAQDQKRVLEKEFLTWKGTLEQVDDICVIGIRV